MEERRMDAMGETVAGGVRRLGDSAQEAAARAAAAAPAGVGRISQRAQDAAAGANERIARYTGKPVEGWAEDARHFVQEHPLKAVALTVALGFVLGKLAARD